MGPTNTVSGPQDGKTGWGVTRNLTNIHEFQQMPLGDKFACKKDTDIDFTDK